MYRLAPTNRRSQSGFTLIELLVVVIILGVLAAVVVFSVRGVGNKGETEAYGIEARTIRTAEEAMCAKAGAYGTERQLLGLDLAPDGNRYKLLSEPSKYHNIIVNRPDGPCGGTGFVITCDSAVSSCGQGGAQPRGAGFWEPTGSMVLSGRNLHTGTLLANGKVLAAAGRLGTAPTTTAELYDPLTGTWSATGELGHTRWLHTATRLPDGKVLVVGGFQGLSSTNAQPVTDTAEIYDPATGNWTRAASLNVRRALHSAVLLSNGKVLVAGGRTCYGPTADTPKALRQDSPPPATCNFAFVTDSAELYDPSTGTWSRTADLPARPSTAGVMVDGGRHTSSMAALPNKRVLYPAGFGASGNNTADVYDEVTATWSTTGNLIQGRTRQGAIQMKDGKVMVVAGPSTGKTVEHFDPSLGTWANKALVNQPDRFNFYWSVLPDGKVLIAGGTYTVFPPTPPRVLNTAEIYDPATDTWADAGPMLHGNGATGTFGNSAEAVQLGGGKAVCGADCGKVLIFGNHQGHGFAQLYNPTYPEFTPELPPPLANDHFINGQVITGGSGSVSGNSFNATKETGEPNHGGNSGGSSVWYRWTAPATGNVVFDTAGSSFDTTLAAYTGSSVAALTLVAGNDDGSGIAPRSRISFAATKDTEYRIAVDGFGAVQGLITLNWA